MSKPIYQKKRFQLSFLNENLKKAIHTGNTVLIQKLINEIRKIVKQFSDLISLKDYKRILGATSFYLIFSNVTMAQSFAPSVQNPFGLTAVYEIAKPTFVDIDDDGDYDLFAFDANEDLNFFENTGTASAPIFASPTTNNFGLAAIPSTYMYRVTFADLDADGDLDAMLGTTLGELHYCENTGTASSPSFAAPVLNPFGLISTYYIAAPDFADLDNDGDFDLIVGQYYGAHMYFENTGTASAPAFAAPLSNPFGLSSGYYHSLPIATDLDSDGDLDILSSEYEGEIIFYRNNGTASAPAFGLQQTNPFALTPGYYMAFLTAADIDNDGDVDVMYGEYYGNFVYFENLMINLGIEEEMNNGVSSFSDGNSVIIQNLNELNSEIQILDLAGKQIYSATINSNREVISMRDFAAGIYFVQSENEKGVSSQKIYIR